MRVQAVWVGAAAAWLWGAAVAAQEPVWLDMASPSAGENVVSLVPLVEVSGRAVRGADRPYDLVVALDVSESTLYPSRHDVDGDGVTGEVNPRGIRRADGRPRPHRQWTTDADDTIVRAELLAAQRLLRRLRGEPVRVGVITFGGLARVRAPLGSPEDALAALARVRVRRDRSGTDLARAIRKGLMLLRHQAEEDREQFLIVLSDGEPTVPAPRINARLSARKAAERAASQGVQLLAFALGRVASASGLLRNMAEITGGRFAALERPGDVVRQLPRLDIAALRDVEISNLTAGLSGRAVRVFNDGAFDGLVPLVPGWNALEICARADDGQLARVQRSVRFERPHRATPELVAAMGDLLERLRERTIETQLSLAPKRRRLRRQLEISLD